MALATMAQRMMAQRMMVQRMMVLRTVALWAIALGAALPGQDERQLERHQQLCRDLAGQDLQRIAWAAYRTPDDASVGRELRLALGTVLAHRGDRLPQGAWRRAAGAVLDAVIRTGTRVPPTELAPWFGARTAEALVIASRDVPRHAGMLLRLLDERHLRVGWVAACNLLVRHRPELVAPELVGRCRIELEVYVVEPDSFGSGFSSSMGMGCGVARPGKLEGWPPEVRYELSIGTRAQDAFAPGPSHVRHHRREGRPRGGRTVTIDRVDYAFRCLKQLADGKAAKRLRSQAQESVQWHDAAQLRTAVEDIAAELRADFRALLVQLARRELVSPAMARETLLPIDLDLVDMRDDETKGTPLPRISLSRPKPR